MVARRNNNQVSEHQMKAGGGSSNSCTNETNPVLVDITVEKSTSVNDIDIEQNHDNSHDNHNDNDNMNHDTGNKKQSMILLEESVEEIIKTKSM